MPAALLRTILHVVLPPACAACGLPGEAVCAGCRRDLVPIRPPICGRCGHPWPRPVEHCPECAHALAGARQAVRYAGPAPALVAALKDARRRDLARPLARLMAAAIPAPAADALVPVPLAAGRLRDRGFNQALLIARALGREWGLPVADVLERVRDGPAQRGASGAGRRAQVAGAFRPRAPAPARACLVDDVHTTGSTLAGCARALRAGGARHVSAVAFARAPRGGG